MAKITDTVSVDLEGAEAVRAVVMLGSGRLDIKGGAESLMEGELVYASDAWKPIVTYKVEDGEGTLKVRPPIREGARLGDPEYEWDIALGDAVPVRLETKVGSGSVNVKGAGMTLSAVDMATASGPATLDLIGDQPKLTGVSLKTASGRSRLVMAGSYGQLEVIDLATASGPVEIELNGHYPALKRLKVGSASGTVRVVLGGRFPALEKLSVNLASGVATVDLRGVAGAAHAQSLGNVKLDCVSGKVTVILPADAPASIKFTALSGKVDAPGFKADGKRMVNDAWDGEGLRLKMSTVSGKLKVRAAKPDAEGETEEADPELVAVT